MERLRMWFWISLIPFFLTAINSATKILAVDYGLTFLKWLNPFGLAFYILSQIAGTNPAFKAVGMLTSINGALTLVGIITAIVLAQRMRALKRVNQ